MLNTMETPHEFVRCRTFSAKNSEIMVVTTFDANILADEIVRLRKELDKISSVLNRNLTTDNKVYEINKILSKE